MKAPRVLDLFCCGGGASMGFDRDGFEVTGLDQDDLSSYYPFTFVRAEAIDWLDANAHRLKEWDLIWASPPCQRFSAATKKWGKDQVDTHPDLVGPVRQRLLASGVPFVMENVVQAPLRKDLMLCGKMFDLDLARHRIFEIEGFTVPQPEHPWPHPGRVITVTGNPGGSSKRDGGSRFGSTADWRRAMDIDWLPARLIREAVPPPYAEYIGFHFRFGGHRNG